MSSAAKQKMFEVRDGSQVLGQFSAKAKAQSFRKQCAAEGIKTKIVTVFISLKEKKVHVGASTPKPSVKPTPPPVPKSESESPPKPPVKKTSPTAPKPFPKPQVKTSPGVAMANAVNPGIIRALASILDGLDNPYLPIFASEFSIISADHISLVNVINRSGTSILGLSDNGNMNSRIDLVEVASKMSGQSDYNVTLGDGEISFSDGKNGFTVPVETIEEKVRPPKLNGKLTFVVDPVALKTELRRVGKILDSGKSRRDRWDGFLRLYGDQGDLMMTASNQGYGVDVDVGDGSIGEGASYSISKLELLCSMFTLSDSECLLTLDVDTPLAGMCSIGNLDLTMMIAPKVGD